MENNNSKISINTINYKRKKLKFKSVKFHEDKEKKSNFFLKLYYNNTFLFNTCGKSIFVIFLIIFAIINSKHIRKAKRNKILNKMRKHNYNSESFTNNFHIPENKSKEIYSTNATLNKGFLEINTKHKGKFEYYDYVSNIEVYKDLYKDISYTPITDNNYLIKSEQIEKEEFSKLCEKGTLLDKTKYKRTNNPKISVVIPQYIRGNQTLTMTIRSIQNQSLKDLEIIIVDDGSIKEKMEDIFEMMKDDNRIILLKHKERKSTLLTRVDGIRYASGEYIIQVDQDDMFLSNLLFEKLYNKSKELDVDLIHFRYCSNDDPNYLKLEPFPMALNTIIKQPELRTAFLVRSGNNRLLYCASRMIWDLFVRRTTFLEAINDLGDEYMNHMYRLYEDTIMMFELSQVAYSYYSYDIIGYRHVTCNGDHRFKNDTLEKELLAMNQLLFMKLMLYKIDPKFDRYHIYRELGFGKCDYDVKYLSKGDLDLGLEVVEAVFELERRYKNTAPQLIQCINKIKQYYET